MLAPVGKRIIVRPFEETKKGSLLLPGQKPTQFTVIAIGDEVTKVKPHDTIYLEKHHGAEIEHDNEKYIVVEESSILAKLD